jgi:uncharacterized membrane protein
MEDHMSKKNSSILFLIGLGICLVATIPLVFGLIGSVTTTTIVGSSMNTQIVTFGNAALFWLAIGMYIVGGITAFVGYLGALIKMAQLEQWIWFVLLLVFSGIVMLVYIFAGPETRAMSWPATYAHSS